MGYNTFLYNQNLYNQNFSFLGDAAQDSIVFNDYSLQNSNIIIANASHDAGPSRDFLAVPTPRDDGEIIISDYWRRKTITMSGVVKADTAILLEAKIDEIKKNLRARNGNLDIKQSDGTIRRYVSTFINPSAMVDRKGYQLTFVPITLTFACLNPFGESKSYVSDVYVAKTDLIFTESYYNSGTIKARPVVGIVFSAASAITAVKITNNTTTEEITLTANIAAGDYVKLDAETREVTINGVIQDYDGFFPSLEVGANSVTMTLTGTSATYALTIKHKTPYL